MSIHVNDAGTLREVTEAYVNDNGALRQITSIDVNDNGTLRSIPLKIEGTLVAGQNHPSSPTTFGYVGSLGSFSTPNNAKLVRIPEFVSLVHCYNWNGGIFFGVSWSSNFLNNGDPYPILRWEIEGDWGSGNQTRTLNPPATWSSSYATSGGDEVIEGNWPNFVSGNTYKIKAILR